MIRSLCVWIVRFCVAHIKSWPWPQLLTGIGCSAGLLAAQQQFFSQLGSSSLVTDVAWGVIALAWGTAWCFGKQAAADGHRSITDRFLLPIILCAVTACSPWLWPLHDRFFANSLLASQLPLVLYVAIWAIVMLGIPVWCTARLTLQVQGRVDGQAARVVPSSGSVLGVALGLVLGVFLTWSSLYVTGVLGCVVLLAATVWEHRSTRQSFAQMEVDAQSSPVTWSMTSLLIAVACGGLSIWTVAVLELLFPASIYTIVAAVAGALVGISYAIRRQRNTGGMAAGTVLSACCLVGVLLILSAGFTEVVYRLVTITGSVSQVWLLHGIRLACIACCTGPIGFVWCSAATRVARSEAAGSSIAWGTSVLLAFVGAAITELILIPLCGITLACYVWLWVIAAVQIIDVLQYGIRSRWSLVKGLAVGCLGALVAAPLCLPGVRPELAARLLFSTNVFQANQAGTARAQLAFLDESRLQGQSLGRHGHYTFWKSTVAKHQLRKNGIPCGAISTNTMLCPQESSEVILALLPLTMHEHPNRVAVLGLGASTPVQTCLNGPIQEVTVVETDGDLVSLVKQVTAGTEAAAQWEDERLSVVNVDPVLWVAGTNSQFDIVISNPDASALIQGASQFTSEFYRRASRRLSSDGIFCQRFQFYDYGAVPLQTMAATMGSVFEHVMAVETGPGEMAWLGTNSPNGFIRSELVDRMQSPHVKELMSHVGWDWSVLLTLAAYDDTRLAKVVGSNASRANTAANGRFCLQLPSEVMRWARKSEEIQEAVTVHADKILSWIGDAGTDDDLLRRLGEVRGQQELVARFPDQYWGYRSQVRKQISSRPLSRVQQVKYETSKDRGEKVGLHPDDKRRLRYFQQLSKAIHTQQPAEVLRLAEYQTPYDPLVSLFMHQELAEIAAGIPQLPKSIELSHRLHMLYYAPSFDTSVRNALSALRLVIEQPDCVASAAERWDVLNALLQTLQFRWQNHSPEQSANARLAARDVEENIVLTERALEELPKLASELGISEADWSARKRNLQRNLLGPLRDYRERLQPLAARQRYETAEAETEETLPTMDELQFPGSDKEEGK